MLCEIKKETKKCPTKFFTMLWYNNVFYEPWFNLKCQGLPQDVVQQVLTTLFWTVDKDLKGGYSIERYLNLALIYVVFIFEALRDNARSNFECRFLRSHLKNFVNIVSKHGICRLVTAPNTSDQYGAKKKLKACKYLYAGMIYHVRNIEILLERKDWACIR